MDITREIAKDISVKVFEITLHDVIRIGELIMAVKSEVDDANKNTKQTGELDLEQFDLSKIGDLSETILDLLNDIVIVTDSREGSDIRKYDSFRKLPLSLIRVVMGIVLEANPTFMEGVAILTGMSVQDLIPPQLLPEDLLTPST